MLIGVNLSQNPFRNLVSSLWLEMHLIAALPQVKRRSLTSAFPARGWERDNL
ncbi:hypothetical protein [Nostoc sp.]|uniref:hypothetical protein n=1 Tax=Nostoc sp. TaxID=1180 RepID=UPI002FF7B7E9